MGILNIKEGQTSVNGLEIAIELMTEPPSASADALLSRLQLLLTDEVTCPWHEVLATATALKQTTALLPADMAAMRAALDRNVISRAYMEMGRPGKHGIPYASYKVSNPTI